MSEDEESYSDFNPIEDDPERKKYNEVLSDSDAESLDERYSEFHDVSDASNESRAFVGRKKSRAPHLEIRQLRHRKDTHKTQFHLGGTGSRRTNSPVLVSGPDGIQSGRESRPSTQ